MGALNRSFSRCVTNATNIQTHAISCLAYIHGAYKTLKVVSLTIYVHFPGLYNQVVTEPARSSYTFTKCNYWVWAVFNNKLP